MNTEKELNKHHKESGIIDKIEETDDGYYITYGAQGFFMSKKYKVEPKKGDHIDVYTKGVSLVRGVDLNGVEVYYKTEEQLRKEHEEMAKKMQKQKEEDFKKNKANLDKKFKNLPEIFQKRIEKFRENNPDFRVDYESYEMFCCEQAISIAKACKTPEEVLELREVDWDEAKNRVPDLDDGHSGNTFGAATALAYWYMKEPENVAKVHGALAPLVGSKEYGDVPKEE